MSKKYSKLTKDLVRAYGRATGKWKNASKYSIREFLDLVEDVKGHINKENMLSFYNEEIEHTEASKERMLFAAREYGKEQGWERLTQNRFDEFVEEVKVFFDTERISADMALDYADLKEQDYLDSLDRAGQMPTERRTGYAEGQMGFEGAGEHYEMLQTGMVDEARIVDVDGATVFVGDSPTGFMDVFRELGGEKNFPIYTSYIREILDEDGNIIGEELVIEITGYY